VIDSSVDPKQLLAVQKRFIQLSEKRLVRMLDSFNLSQADGIKLLPLLFHVNHPMLPGYVDKTTPCGLPNYSPSAVEKKIAKSISRSIKLETRAYRTFEIAGLYLMGSTGTLAQSIRSDLDLWIGLGEPLGTNETEKLLQKAARIGAWMKTKGVELNCYVVNHDQFKRQSKKSLSKDNCGDTQNFLLLDEFYRTAIWLAGRMPLWWIVPAEANYQDYVQQLGRGKHFEPLDWLDFGDVSQIPAAEYFSAALWQLFKAIESPYKSALKLLMLEIYARFFPLTGLLSSQYKQRVYSGNNLLDELDPYLMVLRYAEDFFAEHPQRLEFLRRAFYLKTGVKVDLKKNKPSNWRYQALKNLVEDWRWDQKRLDYLNDRLNWRIDAVIRERADLVRELNHSYHFIVNFARVQGVLNEVSQAELISLGRMLYAVFERRAGKLEKINTGIARDVTEAAITLVSQGSQWDLYLGSYTRAQLAQKTPVYSGETLFVALAWSVVNQVVTLNSNYQVYCDDPFYNRQLVARMVKDLLAITRASPPELGERVFKQPAQIQRLGIFFNTEQDPLQQEKEQGIYSVGNQGDGFCWGENRVNLFAQFDIFWVNSWGEYGCKSYRGDFAWIEFFIDNRHVLVGSEDNLALFGGSLSGMEQHRHRLLQLLHRWNKLHIDSRRNHNTCRFLMSLGHQYLRVDFTYQQVDYKTYRYAKQFVTGLADEQRGAITYFSDANLFLDPLLIRVINKPAETNYQCYLMQHNESQYSVLVKDPSGNIAYQVHQGVELNQLVNHYQQFFDSIGQSLGFNAQPLSLIDYWTGAINDSADAPRLKRLTPSPANIAGHYVSTQAIATRNSEGKIRFDLFAGQHGFYYRDYGELVYHQLAKAIVRQRQSDARYPIFLTNLDLSGVMQQPTVIDYLNYKRTIEQKFTGSLEKLYR
jgi:adenylate cyclase, class 1